MKNYVFSIGDELKLQLLKNLVIMKLVVLFILMSIFQVQASEGYAQTVSLSKRNVSIVEVFREIKKQTNYNVIGRSKLIKESPLVSIEMKDASLKEALDQLLIPVGLSYVIEDKSIVIKEASRLLGIKAIAIEPLIVVRQREVTGIVTDESGNPLVGVSVRIKDKTVGATTNNSGLFSISVQEGDILVFSYIGFTPLEQTYSGQESISVVLFEDIQSIDEVVVVGYGTVKKKTLTGSVTSLDGSSIVESPVMNVSNSLSGRLSGVTTVSRSGEPGNDGAIIRIRGSNTLGNNSALVVIDGIPGRSLDRVDPNSIESITVLKDASAAIYGSQAANGVILVTTKRGKIGKPKLMVNFTKGLNQPTRTPKMLNSAQYATALNELDQYAGKDPRYSVEDIQKFADGSDPWGHPNTDWFDAVLKNWSDQIQANVNISGGGEFARYFVSLGAKGEDAFYKNSATKYNQYDFRTNLDIDVTKDKNIRIGMDVVGRLENSNFPGRGDVGTIINGLLRGKPTMPAYWPTGQLGPDVERGENPAAIATNLTGFTDNKYYVLNTNLKLEINVPWVEGLSFTGNGAIDKGFRFNKRFQQPWYLYSWDGVSYDENNVPLLVRGKKGIDDPNLNQYMEDNHEYLVNGLVNYKTTILEDHFIDFLAGIETRTGGGDNFSAYRRYFVSTALPQLNAGGSNAMNNGGTAFRNARLNYFGRINYNYKEKYLTELVWRVDGSYIFPEAGRYGFFPGVSVGWRVSEEGFWKDNLNSFSEDVKIRASYGMTGNDRIDPWQYISTYGFSTNYIYNLSTESRTLIETRIPNPNVTWEEAKQFDVGIDASFLKNRLSVTVDYFNYNRSNILWQRNASVPTSTGLTLPRENIGKVNNKGFDFDVAYNVRSTDFSYSIGLNGGYAKNKINFWDESPGAPDYQRFTGRPMPSDPNNPNNDLYYEAIGVFRDEAHVQSVPHWPGARAGDVIFKDVNGDGVINANDRVRNEKNDIPTLTGGLSLRTSYRNFDLAVLFQGSAGAIRYLRLEPAGNFGNYLLSDFEDRWTPSTINGTKPRMFDRTDQYFRSERSTYLVHKTDYIRLKNLEIGYNLPTSLMTKIGFENVKIFANGYNLLTFSPDFKDFDPEDNNQGGINYPVQRVINFGLSITL